MWLRPDYYTHQKDSLIQAAVGRVSRKTMVGTDLSKPFLQEHGSYPAHTPKMGPTAMMQGLPGSMWEPFLLCQGNFMVTHRVDRVQGPTLLCWGTVPAWPVHCDPIAPPIPGGTSETLSQTPGLALKRSAQKPPFSGLYQLQCNISAS